jgi:hypothetical protein
MLPPHLRQPLLDATYPPIFFSLTTLRRLSGNFDQPKWEREFRRLMATLEKDSGPQNPAITRERQPPAQKPRAP